MILCVCPNPSVDTFVWIDQLKHGEVHRAQREQRFPGGKGVHVAIACAELGAEVTLLGFWGGPTGQWVRQQCESMRVKCIGPEVKGWTRTCLTFRADGPSDETEILGCGPEVDAEDLRHFAMEFSIAVDKASCVTMSGSWPGGADTDAYAGLIRSTGKPVLLDCTGELLKHALKEHPEAIHLNRLEARDFGKSENPVTAAKELSHDVKLACVTAGAEGAYFASIGHVLHASVKVEKVYSAVGSGDCLMAGIAVARERALSLEDTAKLAVACGAANCLRPELGMLHRKDVEKLVTQATVKRIS